MKSHSTEFERNKKIIKQHLVIISILIIVSFLSIRWVYFQQVEINRLKQIQQTEINRLKQIQQEEVQKQVQEQMKQIQEQEQQSLQKILQDKEQDNISLRKTIQSTSSRGTQPSNYTLPNRESLLPVKKGDYAGEWTITFYTPSKEECGNTKGITASGKYVTPGYTVGVSTKYWKLGTKFYVEGWGLVEAQDTGSGVQSKNRMDICVFDKELANQLGVQKRKVWLIKN